MQTLKKDTELADFLTEQIIQLFKWRFGAFLKFFTDMKRERCYNKTYYAKHTFYEFPSKYCQKMVNRLLPVTLSKKKEGKSSRNIDDRID